MKLVPLYSYKTWPTNNSHHALTIENLVTLVMKNHRSSIHIIIQAELNFSLKLRKKKLSIPTKCIRLDYDYLGS